MSAPLDLAWTRDAAGLSNCSRYKRFSNPSLVVEIEGPLTGLAAARWVGLNIDIIFKVSSGKLNVSGCGRFHFRVLEAEN
jgi:hypothetical protein